MRLLLVEDDQELSRAVEHALATEGYTVDAVSTGAGALFLAGEADYDAVVLDLGLPDIDGLQVLAKLRLQHSALPVLILTARDSVEDRVGGLDAGADDYLSKPFDIPELVARLRAVTRRAVGRSANTLNVGDVTLDPAAHTVQCSGQVIEVSGKEYALLHKFMENPGRLLTKDQLESSLYAWGESISSNAVEVYIHGLRKKIGKDFIKTVRGIGYGVGLE
ncbi:MAG: hypothetical protein RLZZ602_765 [Pseudomonadota bacterium]|jgi:DNA-binding response OmpR family regulator